MKIALVRIQSRCTVLIFLLSMKIVSGQTPGRGAISGVVLDPMNRVVTNVEVVIVNEATHVSRMVRTIPAGSSADCPELRSIPWAFRSR
jgi:hypothetical protein